MKDDMHAVGSRILAIRRSRGFTQADAAERAGLSDRAYADIERGSTNMRVDTLMRICAALDVTPNAILLPQEAPAATEAEALDRITAICMEYLRGQQ